MILKINDESAKYKCHKSMISIIILGGLLSQHSSVNVVDAILWGQHFLALNNITKTH